MGVKQPRVMESSTGCNGESEEADGGAECFSSQLTALFCHLCCTIHAYLKVELHLPRQEWKKETEKHDADVKIALERN